MLTRWFRASEVEAVEADTEVAAAVLVDLDHHLVQLVVVEIWNHKLQSQ